MGCPHILSILHCQKEVLCAWGQGDTPCGAWGVPTFSQSYIVRKRFCAPGVKGIPLAGRGVSPHSLNLTLSERGFVRLGSRGYPLRGVGCPHILSILHCQKEVLCAWGQGDTPCGAWGVPHILSILHCQKEVLCAWGQGDTPCGAWGVPTFSQSYIVRKRFCAPGVKGIPLAGRGVSPHSLNLTLSERGFVRLGSRGYPLRGVGCPHILSILHCQKEVLCAWGQGDTPCGAWGVPTFSQSYIVRKRFCAPGVKGIPLAGRGVSPHSLNLTLSERGFVRLGSRGYPLRGVGCPHILSILHCQKEVLCAWGQGDTPCGAWGVPTFSQSYIVRKRFCAPGVKGIPLAGRGVSPHSLNLTLSERGFVRLGSRGYPLRGVGCPHILSILHCQKEVLCAWGQGDTPCGAWGVPTFSQSYIVRKRFCAPGVKGIPLAGRGVSPHSLNLTLSEKLVLHCRTSRGYPCGAWGVPTFSQSYIVRKRFGAWGQGDTPCGAWGVPTFSQSYIVRKRFCAPGVKGIPLRGVGCPTFSQSYIVRKRFCAPGVSPHSLNLTLSERGFVRLGSRGYPLRGVGCPHILSILHCQKEVLCAWATKLPRRTKPLSDNFTIFIDNWRQGKYNEKRKDIRRLVNRRRFHGCRPYRFLSS